MPLKTAWKLEDILQDMVWLFFQQPPGCWAVYFSRRPGKGEEILSFTFAVSYMLWSFFLQICAQPSRVKCCRVACRAALLPCQLCMSFVYIWFGRTFHDKNQGLQRLWTGGWLGRGMAGCEEWGGRSAATFCWLPTRWAEGAAAWDLVIIVSRKIGTGEISVDFPINTDNSVPEFSGGFLQFDPWSVKGISQPVVAKVATAR